MRCRTMLSISSTGSNCFCFLRSPGLARGLQYITNLINLIGYMEEHHSVDYHDTTVVRKLANWLLFGLHWLIPAALKRLVETNPASAATTKSAIPKCSCANCHSTTCSCCNTCCCIPSLPPSRREQVRAFNRTLMLALSDTQMATDIGILSVAWAHREDLHCVSVHHRRQSRLDVVERSPAGRLPAPWVLCVKP